MKPHAKTALSLALAIVGGIAAGLRCAASEWVDNPSQTNPRPAAYTVKAYTKGSDPFIPREIIREGRRGLPALRTYLGELKRSLGDRIAVAVPDLEDEGVIVSIDHVGPDATSAKMCRSSKQG